MKVVIQCAGSKRDGGYFRAADGRPVKFVAHPELVSETERAGYIVVRPDDLAPDGRTWRDLVLDYDATATNRGNRAGLWQASRLYEPAAYGLLVEKFSPEKVFILSAGWGLIRSSFLTPNYDITFSSQADDGKRRRRRDFFRDLVQLDMMSTEPIVFLGGKDYLALFSSLTSSSRAERRVFYNSATTPSAPGCRLQRYETTLRTNWHYECAARLAANGSENP
jgi:hypothetical protein